MKATLKRLTAILCLILIGSVGLSAQAEVTTAITDFYNGWILPIMTVLVSIALFVGIAYGTILAARSDPNWKKWVFGAVIAAIIFYGGGMLLTDLINSFDSTDIYTIGG